MLLRLWRLHVGQHAALLAVASWMCPSLEFGQKWSWVAVWGMVRGARGQRTLWRRACVGWGRVGAVLKARHVGV